MDLKTGVSQNGGAQGPGHVWRCNRMIGIPLYSVCSFPILAV